MLPITAAESRRARAMPARSPFTSVMPALSIATSVPVPMAMPISAAAGAGAALTPSPGVAGALLGAAAGQGGAEPRLAQAAHREMLLIRQQLGLDLRDAELGRHRLG